MSIPFEGSSTALESARQRKIEKYNFLADELRQNGWDVLLDGFIIGSLGSWLSSNDRVCRALGISDPYWGIMSRIMVSETIRWSRDIYIEHVSGRRQDGD